MIVFLLVATLAKLALAAIAGGTADIRQYLQQARAFLAGADVFDPVNTGNNPSFFLVGHYALASLMALVADATGIPFRFWVKVPAIVSDLAVCLLLRRVSPAGDLAATAYMVNPVTLLLSVHHGQMHSVATAIAVWAFSRGVVGQGVQSGLLLGLGASVRQHFAVLVVPLVMRLSAQRLRLIAGFVSLVVLVNLPLLTSSYAWRSTTPASTPGIWGYSIPLLHGPRVLALAGLELGQPLAASADLLASHGAVLVWAWTVAFVVWSWRRRDADPWHAALLFLVGVYTVTPAFGVQWLVWALPFWLVVEARGAMVYSALAGVYLVGTYWVWTFPARYGVRSITANLGGLSPVDLTLYLVVGALGIVAWLYCAVTAWRLVRVRPAPAGDASLRR